VIGCEPKNADDAYRSLQAGKIIRPEKTDTIADGLRTALGDITFAVARDLVDEIVLISEEEIMEAMRLIFERMKIVIEPSSAVAFAGVFFNKVPVEKKKIGIVLTGGNVDFSLYFDGLV
jgi:threonine dehydratase